MVKTNDITNILMEEIFFVYILLRKVKKKAKPARFALNQGSRKLYSGGITCPGLIRCAGLEHSYVGVTLLKTVEALRGAFFFSTSMELKTKCAGGGGAGRGI